MAEQRAVFEVGLVLRREFRRQLLARGLRFTEDKGWLDSQFIVHGTPLQLAPLYYAAEQLASEK